MGTKTEDTAGTGAVSEGEGAEKTDVATKDATGPTGTADTTGTTDATDTTEATGAAEDVDGNGDEDGAGDGDDIGLAPATGTSGSAGVGQGAAAIVSAALGLVSLSGGWIGTVASARESLIGQLQTSSSSDVAAMVKEGYGDAWNASALWAGAFALLALIVGVVTLARPAFGAPGLVQPAWIKSVSWAGVALGVIGLALAVLKYTDILLGLPATG
ncbi:hypothetical protein [Streptomyces sp. NPDC088789]|uniref:hypothetical protein n=1 Tax=Streptomyces sp. NPDC088789 TaxID=3365899 RepID=UPI0038128CC9